MADLPKNSDLLQKTVAQSNFIIEAFYQEMTLLEKRLLMLAMSKVWHKERSIRDKTYTVSVADYLTCLDVSYKSIYADMENVVDKIANKGFRLRSDEMSGVVNWFQSVIYMKHLGIIEIVFTEKMENYLINLQKTGYFTQYLVGAVMKLGSFYYIRIYELIKQYFQLGERTIIVEDFRNMLGLSKDRYLRVTDLQKHILKPAVKAIKDAQLDCFFEYKPVKRGRIITAFHFLIFKTPIEQTTESVSNQNNVDIELLGKLQIYFCLTEKEANDRLRKFEKSRIIDAISVVENDVNQGLDGIKDKIRDIRSYTIKAIDEGWQPTKQRSILEIEAEQKLAKIKNEKQQEINLEQLKDKFYLELKEQAISRFNQLSKEQKDKIVTLCEDSLDPFSSSLYTQRGSKFEGASLLGIFNQFLVETLLSSEERDFDIWKSKQP